MKPAEIKKRARKLAKDGKIVDAIRALEGLAQSDVVDPYDLVTLGDLCARAGRTEDATAYYQRAVESYRDASLNRNGIALCKKVLRAHSGATTFTLLLGELCEREGLVPDAVDAYLDYAEPLDPETVKGKQPWLDALSALTPRNTGLLTRQAELLVRWDRASEAIELLRRAAQAANTPEQRQQLTEIAGQIAQLGGGFEEAEAMLAGEIPAPDFAHHEPTEDGFDQGYLRDLAHDGIESPSGAAPQPELPHAETERPGGAAGAAEPSGPGVPEEATAGATEATEPTEPDASEPEADESHAHMMDLSELAAAMPHADEPEDRENDVPVVDISDVDERTAEQMSRAFDRQEGEATDAEDSEREAESIEMPELTETDIETAEGLESFAPAGAAARRGFETESDLEDDIPELVAPADDTPAEPSIARQDTLGAERRALEGRLMGDPYDVVTLEKLVEVCTAQGDSHAVLDLRGRLAQAFLQVGRSEPALEQYRMIVEADPSREDMRLRYDRLASELGGGSGNGGQAPDGDSTFNVRGLSKVEVRDDSAASEDDMVDLGALLDEFRDGLSSSMAGAPPRAHYDLGLSHMEMGLLDEAIEAFRSAAEDADLEPEAREMWGRCLGQLDRHDEAIEVLRAALAKKSDSLGIRYQLGVSLELAGESDEARQIYESISRVDPNYEDTRERIASLGGSDCPAEPPERSS